MKRLFAILITMLVLSFALSSVFASAEETKLLRYPDIHEGQIVFTYGGDLYTVGDQGGLARRITSHEAGREVYPKFSPDGKKIAFSGDFEGGDDVYLVDATGGQPQRLTYHPGRDIVRNWTPEGTVLFQSRRNGVMYWHSRLFTVAASGGMPKALPMNTGASASFSPDGTKIAYNRKDRDRRTWKRYKGGTAQDVWIYDLTQNKTTRVTTWEGTDAFPMWQGDKIYFASDREFKMNLFVYELSDGSIRKLTNHEEYDVKWPSMGPGQIVYENGGSLWVLDLATEKSRRIAVTVPSDKMAARSGWKYVGGQVIFASISPSGKRVAMSARGEVFTVPQENGPVRNLTKTSGVREREPVWSPDGKWIAYFTDKTGEMEIELQSQDGKGETKRLTKNGKVFRYGLLWSPDSEKLLFCDKDQKLYWMDVKSGRIKTIDRAVADEIRSYAWSPDSKWVAYVKDGSNRYGSVYLYSLKSGKKYPVTSDTTDELEVVFDPAGRYLYFTSNRETKTFLDVSDATYILQDVLRLFAVTLTSDEPSPFEPQSDEESGEQTDGENGGEEEEAEEEDKPLRLEPKGIENRVAAFEIPSGNYHHVTANEGNVFFLSAPNLPLGGTWEEVEELGTLKRFNMEERELKTVIDKIQGYDLSADGKKIIYVSKGTFGIIDSDADEESVGEGKLNLSKMEMYLEPVKEWTQIYDEAWRLERDFFYDKDMHGMDWKQIGNRYRKLLPYAASRDDVNYLIGEMIGELNCSHTYVWGGDQSRVRGSGVGLLGADLEVDNKAGRYRLKKIYPPDEWELQAGAPLARPGVSVEEGEYLFAVDGRALSAGDNFYKSFQKTADKQITLKVGKNADGKGARDITVVPAYSDTHLRYRHWVNGNRAKVAEATDDKIGYVHLPNMSSSGLKEFARAFGAQVHKQGLIVDIRYNGGGFVSEMILEKLRRELMGMFSARNASDMSYPWNVVHGPMVCIINENSGSDGDIFPYFFRKYGLGKIVGMRTWGGVVGIRLDKLLIDGGMLTMPEYGTYGLNREWIIEGYGVDPDIEVDLLAEDVLAGKDPQLAKAIEIALEELKTNDGTFPPAPEEFPKLDKK